MRRKTGVISTGEWIIMGILMAIPCINIVMIAMWILGVNENPTKRNFAIALVIMVLIGAVLNFILAALNIAAFR